jgi:formylglycine-generating enzyme required for sulfatase activity
MPPSRHERDARLARHYLDRLDAIARLREHGGEAAAQALTQLHLEWANLVKAQRWVGRSQAGESDQLCVEFGFGGVLLSDLATFRAAHNRWLEDGRAAASRLPNADAADFFITALIQSYAGGGQTALAEDRLRDRAVLRESLRATWRGWAAACLTDRWFGRQRPSFWEWLVAQATPARRWIEPHRRLLQKTSRLYRGIGLIAGAMLLVVGLFLAWGVVERRGEDLSDQLVSSEDAAEFTTLVDKARHWPLRWVVVPNLERRIRQPVSAASEHDNQDLARQQSNAAMALLQFGRWPCVWRAIADQRKYPGMGSNLAHRLAPMGFSSTAITDRLQEEKDAEGLFLLILSLGQYPTTALSLDQRKEVVTKLYDLFRNHPDAGVHAAARWLLRRWRVTIPELALGQVRLPPGHRFDPGWFVNSQGETMVLIPKGEFLIGASTQDTNAEDRERPQHPVTLTAPFYLSSCEVTQEDFASLMDGANPSNINNRVEGPLDDVQLRKRPIYREDEQDPALGVILGAVQLRGGLRGNPVDSVSWPEAIEYCNALSRKEKLPLYYDETGGVLGGEGYRLPTEAEWERACRADTQTTWSFGSGSLLLRHYAWSKENANRQTHTVGWLKPNRWGLFDLHGNVNEWCWDSFAWYSEEAVTNPGRQNWRNAILRGGCWDMDANSTRSSDRIFESNNEGIRRVQFGFRVARNAALQNR